MSTRPPNRLGCDGSGPAASCAIATRHRTELDALVPSAFPALTYAYDPVPEKPSAPFREGDVLPVVNDRGLRVATAVVGPAHPANPGAFEFRFHLATQE